MSVSSEAMADESAGMVVWVNLIMTNTSHFQFLILLIYMLLYMSQCLVSIAPSLDGRGVGYKSNRILVSRQTFVYVDS